MSREDDWKRVSALAGLDPEGGIAPPPSGATINRDPHPFWKTKDYSVTETPSAEHSAIDLRMKLSEIAPSAAAALWGSPGVITAMNEYFNAAIMAEREQSSVLKSEDGAFQCTREHAVGEAYLLSCAEAAVFRMPQDRYEIGHKLSEYVAGDCALEEAIAFMNEDMPEK